MFTSFCETILALASQGTEYRKRRNKWLKDYNILRVFMWKWNSSQFYTTPACSMYHTRLLKVSHQTAQSIIPECSRYHTKLLNVSHHPVEVMPTCSMCHTSLFNASCQLVQCVRPVCLVLYVSHQAVQCINSASEAYLLKLYCICLAYTSHSILTKNSITIQNGCSGLMY